MRPFMSAVLLATVAAFTCSSAAIAAPNAEIAFQTNDGAIMLSGGSITSCTMKDPGDLKAEFVMDGHNVVITVVNGAGTVSVSGAHNFAGTVSEARVSEEVKGFHVAGASDAGVAFIANGECS